LKIMENRIVQIFKEKGQNIISIYFTAGYPQLEDTLEILKAIENAGADMVEIGIPFSDPLADGPVIQESGQCALNNGMSLKLLFEQLTDIRKEVNIPILLMGYINPILQFGIADFCKECARVGVDGTIIPDLPIDEYVKEHKGVFDANGLANIFLITPQTSEDRIRYIDENSNGFIYLVSTSSTTGGSKEVSSSEAYFNRITAMELNNPTLIGFNVKDKSSFQTACNHANGAIIGSAFIKILKDSTDLESDIKSFIETIANNI